MDVLDHPNFEEQRRGVTEGVAESVAHLTALEASIGRQLVEVDDSGAWGGCGIRSIEHWASMALGLAPGHTRALLEVTRKLAALPLLDAAVREGRVSFDKARAVAPVATPATEERWMELADQTNVTQLRRIVAAWRKVDPVGGADEPEDAHARRRLWWSPGPGGLEKLTALLTPEEAAIVRAAVDAAAEQDWRETPADDRADEPAAARACDALVALAETAMAAGPRPCEGGDRQKVSLIVDLELLLGRKVDGICGLEHFSRPIALAEAEMLCCDAIIRPLVFADGNPVDVGREKRLVNRAQRRALRARDGGCRFPGCCAARFLDAHHVDHWIRGGRTDLANLVLLCRFHHRLHHRGGFTIAATEQPGRFDFFNPEGDVIGRPPDPPPVDLGSIPSRTGIEPTWLTPHAKDAGGPLDVHAIASGLLWAATHSPHVAN